MIDDQARIAIRVLAFYVEILLRDADKPHYSESILEVRQLRDALTAKLKSESQEKGGGK